MAPRNRQETFSDVVAGGDTRRSLEALRDGLAEKFDAAEGAAAASIARQLTDVMRRLDDLKPAEVSAVDDLAARRSARRADVSDKTGSGVKRRSGSSRTRP